MNQENLDRAIQNRREHERIKSETKCVLGQISNMHSIESELEEELHDRAEYFYNLKLQKLNEEFEAL